MKPTSRNVVIAMIIGFFIFSIAAFCVSVFVISQPPNESSRLDTPTEVTSTEATSEDVSTALAEARAATVFIEIHTPLNENGVYFTGRGTGFIVARHNDRAIIATNCHVVCINA